jgi:hypothetical protein
MSDELNQSIEEILNNLSKYEIITTYTGWGWFLFTVIGMSATPSKVEFVDKNTGKIEGESNNKKILKKFVGR